MARALRRLLWVTLCGVVSALLAETTYRAWLYRRAPHSAASGAQFEIYGVGESTLVGEPFDPKVSIPRILQHVFGNQMAGRPLVVKNLAVRGQPLYPQSIVFDRALASRDPRDPGVVLIMSGHNEGIAPDAGDAERAFFPSAFTERSALLRDIVLALSRRHVVSREKSLAAYE